MKTALILAIWIFATSLGAQTVPDEAAVRRIIQDEGIAWNKGARLWIQDAVHVLLSLGAGGSSSGEVVSGKYRVSIRNFSYVSW
jgi:hypothetical protein